MTKEKLAVYRINNTEEKEYMRLNLEQAKYNINQALKFLKQNQLTRAVAWTGQARGALAMAEAGKFGL